MLDTRPGKQSVAASNLTKDAGACVLSETGFSREKNVASKHFAVTPWELMGYLNRWIKKAVGKNQAMNVVTPGCLFHSSTQVDSRSQFPRV